MKNLSFFVATCLCFSLFSQQDADWKIRYTNPILWYHQAPTGLVITHTADKLHGIDPLKKGEAWQLEGLGEINLSENYIPVGNTQYVRITGLKIKKEMNAIDKFFSDGRTILLNTYTGKVVYDSDKHVIKNIQQEIILEGINCVFIIGKEDKKVRLSLVSIETSEAIWTIDAPEGIRDFTFDWAVVDPQSNLLVKSGKNLARISQKTGELLWHHQYPLIRYVFFSPQNSNRFYGRMGWKNPWTNSFDLTTGTPLWFDVKIKGGSKKKDENFVRAEKDQEMKNKLGEHAELMASYNYAVPDDDMFLLTTKEGFNFYDYEDASPKWTKPVTFKKELYQVVPQEGGYVAKLGTDKKWLLALIDEEGNKLWKKARKVKGDRLYSYALADEGVMYITNKRIGMIDRKTGKQAYKAFKLDDESLPYFDVERKKAAVYQKKKLYEIDLVNGSVTKIGKKIKLRGDKKDLPSTLEWTGEGYFIANNQNLVHTAGNDSILYQQYHKFPGAPMWLKRTASAALSSAIAMSSYRIAAAGTYGTYGKYLAGDMSYAEAGAVIQHLNLNNPNSALSTATAAGMGAAALIAQRNYASYDSKDFKLVMTELEDDRVGMLKINKATGQKEDEIILDEANPSYFVDDHLGIMYYMLDNYTINVYEMK
jgi:outer membrane protein assembly factor BamB